MTVVFTQTATGVTGGVQQAYALQVVLAGQEFDGDLLKLGTLPRILHALREER